MNPTTVADYIRFRLADSAEEIATDPRARTRVVRAAINRWPKIRPAVREAGGQFEDPCLPAWPRRSPRAGCR